MATEKRLIDANALLIDIDNYYNNPPFTHPGTNWTRGLELTVGLLLRAPTVDAVEVVHGRWNEKQEQIPWCEDDVDTYWMCSVCGAIEIGKTNYCHNCGAKMDGDGNG